MSSQNADRSAVIPYTPKVKNTDSEADQLDRAGNAILGLVHQAANLAEGKLQDARDAAERLTNRLRAAHNQINELKARVRYYQDRTNRAEKWLHQISSEIEQRFFDADDSGSVRNSMR